jgi:phenylacetic acid degradation protein PaaD
MVFVDEDQLARRCADAMYAADAASQHVGIVISDVAPGRATATMRVTVTMVNGHGVGHGGYVALLADTAFAFACNTYDARTVAQGFDISLLAPVYAGDELIATAAERFRRGRSGLYDVTVRRGDEVVAEFRGRSRTIAGAIISPQ